MHQTLNPLLLEHIVELILDELLLPDVNTCSMVCKLWYEEAKKVKRKWKSVYISNQEDISDLIQKLTVNGAPKVDKLEAKFLILEDPNFSRLLISLESTLTTLILADDLVTLKTFHKLLRYLPNLMRLEFGTLKASFDEYLSLFPVYDESVPRKMVIFDKIVSLEFVSYSNPTTLRSAFQTFPKVKQLSVFNLKIENLDNLPIPILEGLAITNFEDNVFSDRHLEMLRKMKIDSLKSLKISNFSRDMNVLLFKEFVERQKSTLTSLELHQNKMGSGLDTVPVPYNPFPMDLQNLTFLAVDKPFVKNLSHVYSLLPKLEHIAFNFHENSNWMGIFPKKMEAKNTVTSCSIHWIDQKSLSMLPNIFPCITSLLILNCTDDTLRTIYSFLPNLEVLICIDMTDGEVTSTGITGIQEDCLAKLLHNSEMKIMTEELDKFRQFPAITSLKKLKHLTLRFKESTISTSTILFYGIVKVQSLLKVSLEGIELSSDTIRTLEKDFERQVVEYKQVEITNGHSYHIISGDIQDAWDDYKTYKNLMK